MDDKLHGIVLQSLRYGDSSLIVRVYTRELGLQSYILKGALGKGRHRAAFFQPLNMIEFVATPKRAGSTLAFVKDVQMGVVYRDIPSDMKKGAILMFVGELLSKSLTGEERHVELYDFVAHCMQWLDLADGGFANFPIYFVLELSRLLGFYPKSGGAGDAVFDMAEGVFAPGVPLHPYYMDGAEVVALRGLLGASIDAAMAFPMGVELRRGLLEGLVTFMRLHVPGLKVVRSHEVLRVVLA